MLKIARLLTSVPAVDAQGPYHLIPSPTCQLGWSRGNTAHSGNQCKTHWSEPLVAGLLTSVLMVNPEAALWHSNPTLHSGPRGSAAHPETWCENAQGRSGYHTIHDPGKGPFNCGPRYGTMTRLFNHSPAGSPSTQGTDRIQTTCIPNYIPAKGEHNWGPSSSQETRL